jgi:hypothetical protein
MVLNSREINYRFVNTLFRLGLLSWGQMWDIIEDFDVRSIDDVEG